MRTLQSGKLAKASMRGRGDDAPEKSHDALEIPARSKAVQVAAFFELGMAGRRRADKRAGASLHSPGA
jgi:hypothetical protein